MFNKLLQKLVPLSLTAVAAVGMMLPVSAINPPTGDSSGALLPVMGVLLVVSVILIGAYFLLSKKKKKK